jgi:hypothetical protein
LGWLLTSPAEQRSRPAGPAWDAGRQVHYASSSFLMLGDWIPSPPAEPLTGVRLWLYQPSGLFCCAPTLAMYIEPYVTSWPTWLCMKQ